MVRMDRFFLAPVMVFLLVFASPAAYAACSNPTGEEGAMIYNDDYNVVQYCNGSDWKRTGERGSDGGSGGSGGSSAGGNDPVPDAYTVTDLSDITMSTLTTSEIVQFTNFDTHASIGVVGGDSEFRLCADATCSSVLRDWGGDMGYVYNDQYAQFRVTSADTMETAVNVYISVGGVADTWTVVSELNACTDVDGVCWYLAPVGQSCDDACAGGTRGGYNAATLTYAGSDGTNANCESVLDALGAPGTAVTDLAFNKGVGCFAYPVNSLRYRDTGAATTGAATYSVYSRACACNG